MKHYGISPWEINVITSILDKRFKTEDEEIENTYEDKFVSHLEIGFPYSFNEEFFKWFDFKEWDRLKGVFKEMKRRRGDGKAIKIELNFSGDPDIKFIVQPENVYNLLKEATKAMGMKNYQDFFTNPVNVPDELKQQGQQQDPMAAVLQQKAKADMMKAWDDIAEAVEADRNVTGVVIQRVKGGLQVDIGVRAFLPGSQVDLRPVKNLDKFIGESYEFKIIKFKRIGRP